MPEWLEHLFNGRVPGLLDLASNLWWLAGLMFAGLMWTATRLGLRRQCNKQHVENWFHQLGHSKEGERLTAQKKLMACGKRAVVMLVNFLHETEDDTQRELGVDVLCEIGVPALKPLLRIRKDEILAEFVDAALQKQLSQFVQEEQFERETARVLKRLWIRLVRSERIVDKLIVLLDDDDPIVQEGAVLALGQYSQPKVVKALGKKLYPTECTSTQIRETVAKSLGQTKQPEAVPFLQIGLKDPDHNVRLAACESLYQIKLNAIPALGDTLLPFESPMVQKEAARALGHIGGKEAIEILKRAQEIWANDNSKHELNNVVSKELARAKQGLFGEEVK